MAESMTTANTRRWPPHGHASTSAANTRRSSSAHGPGRPGWRRTAPARRMTRRRARVPARGAWRAAGTLARTRQRSEPGAGAVAEWSRKACGEMPPAAAPARYDHRVTVAFEEPRRLSLPDSDANIVDGLRQHPMSPGWNRRQ
jgi:hypothetical protein